MSRGVKIVLGCALGFSALCCLLGIGLAFWGERIFTQMIEDEAFDSLWEGVLESVEDSSTEVGQSIADYQLPLGYAEEQSLGIFGVKMVMITEDKPDVSQVIMMVEMPASLVEDEEQLRQQLEDGFQSEFENRNVEFAEVSREEVVINGKTATLLTFEGSNDSGESIRQQSVFFEGKSGNPALMLIAGSAETWDTPAIEQFLTSLRGTGR